MSRRARCLILAEDRLSQRILQKYAERFFDRREITPLDLPAGRQAGDQFVRQEYPRWLKECRRRNSGLRATVLRVHTDADTRTVLARQQQLDQCLVDEQLPKRDRSEPVALVIPKRHTEAWLFWLEGAPPDEEYDFTRDPQGRVPGNVRTKPDSLLGNLAAFLYNHTRPNTALPPDLPDSLKQALVELRRIE